MLTGRRFKLREPAIATALENSGKRVAAVIPTSSIVEIVSATHRDWEFSRCCGMARYSPCSPAISRSGAMKSTIVSKPNKYCWRRPAIRLYCLTYFVMPLSCASAV